MADLTWNELSAQCPSNSIFDDATKGICIDVTALTGDTRTNLSDEGVSELIFKLCEYANKAQKAKNNSLPTGQKLTAFSDATYSAPSAGDNPTTTARHSVNVLMPVNTNDASSPVG